MRILLEGVDKCGKTYLANYLSKELNMPIKKFSQPKTPEAFDEYIEFFGTAKENKKEVKNNNIICDRSWVGEQSYGPIYRKKKMKKFQVRRLDESCVQAGDIIVYCIRDTKDIKKAFIEDKETFTQLKDINRLKRYYSKTLVNLKTPVIMYDFSTTSMESIKNIISAFIIVNTK